MSTISRHAIERMQRRGRRVDEIAFVLEHGTSVESGVMFTEKDRAAIEHKARYLLHMAKAVCGVYLPMADDTVKTVFRASRRQQRRR